MPAGTGEPRARGLRRVAAALLLACAVQVGGGCSTCPPAWAAGRPDDGEWRYAAATCGDVYVEADALQIALVRAARGLADRLALDVESRLSVVHVDGRLFVEAVGRDGREHGLDGLELVARAECEGVTHVLVRLARS